MTVGVLAIAAAVIVVPAPAGDRRAARLGVGARARTVKRRRVSAGWLVLGVVPVWWEFGVGAVLAGVLAVGTGRILLRRSRVDRLRSAGRRELLDALDVVIGELRVGAHPAAAAETAAREAGGTAGRAFGICAGRGRLGGSAASGLRIPDSDISAELDRVACAWTVAEEHGLALAELLAAARLDLLGRIRFRGRTEAALAGARASAAVLAGLPLLGIGLGELMGARPVRLLFHGGLGGVLLLIGVGLVCAGLLWTEAIVRRVVIA